MHGDVLQPPMTAAARLTVNVPIKHSQTKGRGPVCYRSVHDEHAGIF